MISGDDPRTADTQESIAPTALPAVDVRNADTQIAGFPPVPRGPVPPPRPRTGRQVVWCGHQTMIAGALLDSTPRALSPHQARTWAGALLRTRLLPWQPVEHDGWRTSSDLLVQQYALFPDRGWILLGEIVREPRPPAATDEHVLAWAEGALRLTDPPAWLPGPGLDGLWYAALPDPAD